MNWGTWRRGGGGVKSAANPLALKIGSIVTAPIKPDGGVTKMRPAVVIEPPSADFNDPVWVIGITTDNETYDPTDVLRYPPELFWPMPYAADGSSETKFLTPCAAKADWIEAFRRSQLKAAATLSGQPLDDLLTWIDEGDEAEIKRIDAQRRARFGFPPRQ